MPSTARGAFPYPADADAPDGPAQMQALADQMAAVGALYAEGTAAARPAAAAAQEGRFYWATDTVQLSYCDGAAWYAVAHDGATLASFLNLADQQLRRPYLRDYAEVLTTTGAAGAALALNLEDGNTFDVTLDQNVTFTFTNPPAAGRLGSLLLILRQPAALKSVTWPASVDWPSATAPVFVGPSVNLLSFVTVDAGVTWLGIPGGLDIR